MYPYILKSRTILIGKPSEGLRLCEKDRLGLEAFLAMYLSRQLRNSVSSGGRDQEDHGSKLAWANSFRDSILKKNSSQKRAGGLAQGVGPEFKHYHCKRKKERNSVS
jgi:hypothetical protein